MSATANFSTKISLDDSNFAAGMRRVRNASQVGMRAVSQAMERASDKMRKVSATMSLLGGKLKNIGMIAGTITFAGATAGSYAFARGLKSAIDVGGKLSDLSARSGESVSSLTVLREAFRQAGVSGDAVGITLDRLTRRTEIATQGNNSYAKALQAAGLDAEALTKMGKAERFMTVAKAFSAMTDESKKTAAAMDLLDTSAGELFGLFNDVDAFKKAGDAIGSQAQLLEKNADTFDRISDLLGIAAIKLQGFFVGFADKVAPAILEKLEAFNKMDFTQLGQNLGEAFQPENLKNTLSDVMTLATTAFRDGMINAVVQASSILKKLMSSEGMFELKALNDGFSREDKEKLRKPMQGESDQAFDKRMEKMDQTFKKLDEARNARFSKYIQNVMSNTPKLDFSQTKKAFQDITGGKSSEKEVKDGFAKGPLGWMQRRLVDKIGVGSAPNPILPDQVSKVAAVFDDDSSPTASPNPKSSSSSGGFIGAMMANLSRAAFTHPAMKSIAKSAEMEKAGFSGLAGLHTMQAEKAMGVRVGENNIFANDRKRLGLSGGLQTGGLGATRKVGGDKEKEEKQLEPLESIASNTADTASLMREALK